MLMAQLSGTGGNLSYFDWKQTMLSKEEEFDLNGMLSNQILADDLYAHRIPSVQRSIPSYFNTSNIQGFGVCADGKNSCQRTARANTNKRHGRKKRRFRNTYTSRI